MQAYVLGYLFVQPDVDNMVRGSLVGRNFNITQLTCQISHLSAEHHFAV